MREVSAAAFNQALATNLVDVPGFTPTLLHIGRMFLLYLQIGRFPDYVIHPAPNDRIVEVVDLYPFIQAGFLNVVIFPFNSKLYYRMRDRVGQQEAVEMALEKGTQEEIQNYLNVAQISTNVHLAYDANFRRPSGSMKSTFLTTFFKNGKWIEVTYEQHVAGLKTLKPEAVMRASLLAAIEHLQKKTAILDNGMIATQISHLNFLK